MLQRLWSCGWPIWPHSGSNFSSRTAHAGAGASDRRLASALEAFAFATGSRQPVSDYKRRARLVRGSKCGDLPSSFRLPSSPLPVAAFKARPRRLCRRQRQRRPRPTSRTRRRVRRRPRHLHPRERQGARRLTRRRPRRRQRRCQLHLCERRPAHRPRPTGPVRLHRPRRSLSMA